MLAARATAGRAARLSRNFATAVESAGYKVAAVDHGQPTSAVTFLVKAGSRYEPKPGVANALKNFTFKATSSRSAIGTVRETELYGGVLSTTLTREHLALTAEFLRGDEAYFVDVLSSIVSSSKFSPWEFTESVVPAIEGETQAASTNSAVRALELAHALAFRTGLGSSIFAPAHPSITSEDVKSYAAQAFGKGNLAILGTGIDQATLSKLVEKYLASSKNTAPFSTPASKYFGGETREGLNEGLQTIFLGFGAAGAPSAELAVLSEHLSPTPSVKWSKGTSPLSSIPHGTSVQTVLLPYSDATLFGLLIQGESADGVKEAAASAVKALKEAGSSGSIKADDLKKAVAKAKFNAASAVENREGFVATFGPQVLSGSEASINGMLNALDNVSSVGFSKAVSSFAKATPTFVAVGDTNFLPYKDEIGL